MKAMPPLAYGGAVSDDDLYSDLPPLKQAFEREREAELAAAASNVVTWTHARGATNSPYRAAVFERERGAVYRKVLDGQPADLRDVTLFGLDARGRQVHERAFNAEGELVWETVGRHDEDERLFITYGLDRDREWAAEYVALERWDGDRVLSVSRMTAFELGEITREHYVYDGDRVVEIVTRRSEPWENGSREQALKVEYGADGKPSALINGGHVEWRRRAGSRERGAALRAAEDALTAGLAQALSDWAGDLPDQVLLLHQDDGDWTDQGFPEIAVPADGEASGDPRSWLPAEWATAEPAPEQTQAITAALTALDETGSPAGDEPRQLLRIVARRVAALVERRRGTAIRCVVTTHDPEDITADMRQ